MLNFGMTTLMPFDIAVPNVSLTCMKTTDFGAAPTMAEQLELIGKGAAEHHRRGREIPEYEFVALLGDIAAPRRY